MRTGRFDDAARAYAQIARLKGDSPETLADWGEALTAAGDGTVSPQAKDLFEKALAKDAKAAKARFYVARAAEQAGDTGEAIRQLTTLESVSAPDAPGSEPSGRPSPGSRASLRPHPRRGRHPGPSPPSNRRHPRHGRWARCPPEGRGGTPDEWIRLILRAACSASVTKRRPPWCGAHTRSTATVRVSLKSKQRRRRSAWASPGCEATSRGPSRPHRRRLAPTRRPPWRPCAPCPRPSGMPPCGAWSKPSTGALGRRAAAPTSGCGSCGSYSVLGEREQAERALDRARMALAANGEAVARLDGLARDLAFLALTPKVAPEGPDALPPLTGRPSRPTPSGHSWKSGTDRMWGNDPS